MILGCARDGGSPTRHSICVRTSLHKLQSVADRGLKLPKPARFRLAAGCPARVGAREQDGARRIVARAAVGLFARMAEWCGKGLIPACRRDPRPARCSSSEGGLERRARQPA